MNIQLLALKNNSFVIIIAFNFSANLSINNNCTNKALSVKCYKIYEICSYLTLIPMKNSRDIKFRNIFQSYARNISDFMLTELQFLLKIPTNEDFAFEPS